MIDAAGDNRTEIELLAPLVSWLRSRRQIRDDSLVVHEFPWLGRRVDLAVLTASGVAAAYELKLAHNRRAIEQSYLNGVAFDRSYLVTATKPSERNAVQAAALGIGIIHVDLATERVSLLLASARSKIHPQMKRRLREALSRRRAVHV